jgi:hypothetical protein
MVAIPPGMIGNEALKAAGYDRTELRSLQG